MKAAAIYIAFLIVCLDAPGGEPASKGTEDARKAVRSQGVPDSMLVFEPQARAWGLVVIKRDNAIVGYFMGRSAWEHNKLNAEKLQKVTRIAYGYGPTGLTHFEVVDSHEVQMWLTAYLTNTEVERHFQCLVPTAKDAPFKQSEQEVGCGALHGCKLGLRFYAGEQLLLELSGHLHESAEFDPQYRNFTLHALTRSKMPEPDNEDDPLTSFPESTTVPNPFGDDKRNESTKSVEPAGAGQPATKPADKPPVKDQPSTPTSKVSPR